MSSSTPTTLPYTIVEQNFSYVDDRRPLLPINKEINQMVSRWHYVPILNANDTEQELLPTVIKACIRSLLNTAFESGLAKLLRDPKFQIHWRRRLAATVQSEESDQFSELYSLLCKDIDALDSKNLIREN